MHELKEFKQALSMYHIAGGNHLAFWQRITGRQISGKDLQQKKEGFGNGPHWRLLATGLQAV